jgi:hypothetical protein
LLFPLYFRDEGREEGWEIAKESPEDLLIQISVHNRGPQPADLHILPTLWFRNTWSWGGTAGRPRMQRVGNAIKAVHPELGERFLHCEGNATLLFTENETNTERIFGVPNRSPYVKDGINNYVVHGQKGSVNPEERGTKAAAHYHLTVKPGECQVVRVRLSDVAPGKNGPFSNFDDVLEIRHKEADQFYGTVIPRTLTPDQANVIRQALAGMMWTKQFYHYDVDRWLEERGSDPFKATLIDIRRREKAALAGGDDGARLRDDCHGEGVSQKLAATFAPHGRDLYGECAGVGRWRRMESTSARKPKSRAC